MASSFFFFSLLFISMALPLLVSSHQFQVGDNIGWDRPTGNDSDTYNRWASENRFHVGDTLHFKYQKDSVLVVKKSDYQTCVISNPISKFEDGDTVFRFDRFGFFYFISGQPGHCKSGQRMIIRVMVHPDVESPDGSPTPESNSSGHGSGHDRWDSDAFGPPGFINATTKLSVVSYFMTAFVAVFVVLYMFMD